MDKKSKILVISFFIISILFYLIGFLLMNDLSFIFIGTATILVGFALLILIYQFSSKIK